MKPNTDMLKSILYLFFGILFMFFSACGDSKKSMDCQKSPSDPLCIEEQKREAEEQQVQAQEQAKFKSMGDCLKAKKAEAGIAPDAKPTSEMLQQCIRLQA